MAHSAERDVDGDIVGTQAAPVDGDERELFSGLNEGLCRRRRGWCFRHRERFTLVMVCVRPARLARRNTQLFTGPCCCASEGRSSPPRRLSAGMAASSYELVCCDAQQPPCAAPRPAVGGACTRVRLEVARLAASVAAVGPRRMGRRRRWPARRGILEGWFMRLPR